MQPSRICARVSGLRLRSASLALVTLIGLVLGHVSAWAHDGAVRHVRCATHGELVDAPELDRAIASGSWLVGVEGQTGDDHCSLANGIRHSATRATTPPALHAAPPVHAIAIAIVTPRLAAAIDFRIAPKTSPPGC